MTKKQPHRWSGLAQRNLTRGHCPRCRARTITGIRDSFPIHLDPAALNQLGELDALLVGVTTYHRVDENLYRRNRCSIARWPTPVVGTIHAEHKCGRVIFEAHCIVVHKHDPKKAPDRCPY